jgi:hypothetical protein
MAMADDRSSYKVSSAQFALLSLVAVSVLVLVSLNFKTNHVSQVSKKNYTRKLKFTEEGCDNIFLKKICLILAFLNC